MHTARRQNGEPFDTWSSGSAPAFHVSAVAAAAQELETKFAQHPAPALETLLKLQRVLILRLSDRAGTTPEFAAVVNRMMRTAVEVEREQLRTQLERRRVELAEQKFQFDAAEACLDHLPELKAISNNHELSIAEQIDQIRIRLFGVAV